MATIHVQNEMKRNCGFRRPGGFYFVSGHGFSNCDKLPFVLPHCEMCGAGFKPIRSFQWIDKKLFGSKFCHPLNNCDTCPLGVGEGKMLLMWVGEKFYTAKSFIGESMVQGISKRIPALPKGFEVGKTWVALAHRKGKVIWESSRAGDVIDGRYAAAVFMCFRPDRIEYILKPGDSPEFLDSLEAKGIKIIDSRPIVYPQASFLEDVPNTG